MTSSFTWAKRNRCRKIKIGGWQKGGFQKGGFGGCSPGKKTGTRVRSPKPPFYETALLSPQWAFLVLTKGWFPKGWFRRTFPRNENRNEGTFAKTTLLRNRPFISQWKKCRGIVVTRRKLSRRLFSPSLSRRPLLTFANACNSENFTYNRNMSRWTVWMFHTSPLGAKDQIWCSAIYSLVPPYLSQKRTDTTTFVLWKTTFLPLLVLTCRRNTWKWFPRSTREFPEIITSLVLNVGENSALQHCTGNFLAPILALCTRPGCHNGAISGNWFWRAIRDQLP